MITLLFIYLLLCCNFACRILSEKPEIKLWVMKAPYTSNSRKPFNQRNLATVNDIMKHIKCCVKYVYKYQKNQVNTFEIPYLILQEQVLIDKSEVKICFLNKCYSHIVMMSTGTKRALGSFSEKQIVAFAYKALLSLKDMENTFVLNGLIRVDVFLSNANTLVVNELESLDATYYSTNFEGPGKVDLFLEKYWERQMYNNICEFSSEELI